MRVLIQDVAGKNITFGNDVKARVQKVENLYFVVFEDKRIQDVLYLKNSIIYCRCDRGYNEV